MILAIIAFIFLSGMCGGFALAQPLNPTTKKGA